MLALNSVCLRRGGEILFEDATFTIHRGYKVGLVGANGSGKTSLFKLIQSELEVDRGELDMPAATRIAHMAQEVHSSTQSAIDYVLSGDQAFMETMLAITQAEQSGQFEEIASLHERLDSIDGYTARTRAEILMAGLGFVTDEFEKPLSEFSGGWRIRLNLAQTLMQPADLLLLDEPTNHLDLDAILWLSDWIRGFQGTLLLISHDREFLDESVGHIAYLHHKTIELFAGNYSVFEKIKAARLAEQQSNFEKQQREIAHMHDFVRRFRAKATKARQAQSRIKALSRMELIAPAHIDSPFHFEIQSRAKVSSPLISLQEASLGYTDKVLGPVNLSFEPGDRFGLLGTNGAGKSTLIKTLNGALPLLAGARVEGTNLKIGYFSQHQLDELELGSSAFDHVSRLGKKIGKIVREQEIRNFLGGFNFHGDKVIDSVASFSGGEKARLALALITYSEPNLLLMDEPTNHLDIDMRQALTVALQSFAGALLLVSHDRHLMTNTVDQFILVEAGEVRLFDGDLEDYRIKVQPKMQPKSNQASTLSDRTPDGQADTAKVGPAAKKAGTQKALTQKTPSHKSSRQLRTRLRTLDNSIERLERKLAEVESGLGDPSLYQKGSDSDNLHGLLRDQLELKSQLEALENEWLELTHRLEAASS